MQLDQRALRGRALFFAPDDGRVQALAPGRLECQPDWFAELDEPTRQEVLLAEERGEFTGARLFFSKPAIYKACVAALGSGELGGVKRIAKALRISVNTVRAVRDREGFAVDTLREKAQRALACAALDIAERFAEESHELKIGQAAVPLGIIVEKMELLAGRATSRVEVVEVSPIESFNDYIAGLKSAKGAGMGLGAGDSPQKETGADGDADAARDGQSLVLPAVVSVEVGDDTAIDTASTAPAPASVADTQGGRGSLSEPPLSPSQFIPSPKI